MGVQLSHKQELPCRNTSSPGICNLAVALGNWGKQLQGTRSWHRASDKAKPALGDGALQAEPPLLRGRDNSGNGNFLKLRMPILKVGPHIGTWMVLSEITTVRASWQPHQTRRSCGFHSKHQWLAYKFGHSYVININIPKGVRCGTWALGQWRQEDHKLKSHWSETIRRCLKTKSNYKGH